MTISQPLMNDFFIVVDVQLEHLTVTSAVIGEIIIAFALLGLSASEVEKRLPLM